MDFLDIPSAFNAIRGLERNEWDALPTIVQETLDKTAEVGTSPVDRIVRVAEAIYANRIAVSENAAEIAAALFLFAAMNGWHGLTEDNRASRAAAILRGGDDAEAPEPVAEFVPQPAVDEE